MANFTRKVLMNYFKPQLRQQLTRPSNSMIGKAVKHFLRQRNGFLEKCAVKLSKIEPDHKVLEIGFGGGVGLRCAYWRVREGEGRIYGLDFSDYMVKEAKKFCALEIAEEKVELFYGDVAAMPFPDLFFDRVFHCNSYYFWPDLDMATREIYRVMKPGSKMTTTLILDSLKELEDAEILTGAQTDPIWYMKTLEEVGFRNVGIKYLPYRDKLVYQAISAEKPDFLGSERPLDEQKQNQLLKVLEKEVNTWETRKSVIRLRRPPTPNETKKNQDSE